VTSDNNITCSRCGEPCDEVYRIVDSVSYQYRDRNVTDNIYDFVSDCCGASVIHESDPECTVK